MKDSRVIKRSVSETSNGARSTPATKKVITRQIALASEEAQQILANAEQQALNILAQARAEAEACKKQAEQEGFAEGLARWEPRLQELDRQMRQILDAARPQILKLSMKIAEKILRRRLEMEPETIMPILEETLNSVQGFRGGHLLIRVHPDDGPILETYRTRLMERHPWWQRMEIVLDAEMTRGGCCIETEFGTIDARVETQLLAIEHLLGRGDTT